MAVLKKWDVDFVGTLATQSDMEETTYGRRPIIINQQNTIQFYLKIISHTPHSFPNNIHVVTCFAEELVRWGFEDNINLSEDDRILWLEQFLNKILLIFRVEMSRSSSMNQIKDFYTAKGIRIAKKADSYDADKTFLTPFPIFNEEISQKTKEEFEDALLSQKYVGNNVHISKENDDFPTHVIWHDESVDTYTIYGEFMSFSHAFGGFKFNSQDTIYLHEMKEDWIEESYIDKNVMFITWDVRNEIEESWESNSSKLQSPLVVEDTEEEVVKNTSTKKTTKAKESAVNDEIVEEMDDTQEPINNEEKEFMNRFIQRTVNNGLSYNEKDLYNFHTAVKTGNLVVLAGMSGTGKSKLVQEYADALKIPTDNLLFVPVRPFWQDDSDVIGYLDTLNNVYRPGDSGLVNFLINAQNEKDSIFIVCFDEMNLARVEHYFSQFLSVLEMEESKRQLKIYNEEYATRIHNNHTYESSISIGKNVFFVGTVNVDESTHHFSDKVLDRANVINLTMTPFDELLTLQSRKKTEKKSTSTNAYENLTISYAKYESFVNKQAEDMHLTEVELQFFWELHNLISKYNKNIGVGWRIVRQIDKYLKNIPNFGPLLKQEAFDIQVVQRIMTKVRGSEEQLQHILGTYDIETETVSDSQLIELLDKFSAISEFTKTRDSLVNKSKELLLHGHTI